MYINLLVKKLFIFLIVNNEIVILNILVVYKILNKKMCIKFLILIIGKFKIIDSIRMDFVKKKINEGRFIMICYGKC